MATTCCADPPKRRIFFDYSYPEQIRDILPGILLAVLMGCCVYPIHWLGLPDAVTLLIQVPLGIVIYIGVSAVLRLDSYKYVMKEIQPYLKKMSRK